MNSTPDSPSLQRPGLQTADGAVFPLKPGDTLVGRDPSCHIQLHDPSVSKTHCAITISERGASITDLGSTNHTFVNQSCLRRAQSTQLLHGDRLMLGRTILTFLDPNRTPLPPEQSRPAEPSAPKESPSESTIISFDIGTPFHHTGKRTPSDAVFRELRKANERLSIFYDFGRQVGNILDVDQLLASVARRIFKLIPADSGLIFLKRLDELHPFLFWTREGFQDVSRATYSRTALTRAIQQKRGFFVRDVASQPDLSAAESVRSLHIQSTMIVPIILKNEILGALSLSACGPRADFGPDDFAMISGIAGQIAVALKNTHLAKEIQRTAAEKDRLQRELEIAAHVQKSILPAASPSLPGLDIAGVSIPAREVGGDFFDYIPLGATSLGTTIADVSGKGLAAALLTLQSRNVIHALAKENTSPADVLHKANSVIYNDFSRADMFLSAFYGIIDLSSRTLLYASAGHHPPLLLRADGTCSSLNSTGSVVGIFPNMRITEQTVNLAANDLLALYTDGVSEARNQTRSEFGYQKLAERLSEYRSLPAQEIADRILGEVTSLAGPAHFDDATLVVLKIQPH